MNAIWQDVEFMARTRAARAVGPKPEPLPPSTSVWAKTPLSDDIRILQAKEYPWREQLPLKIISGRDRPELMQPHGSDMPWHAMEFKSRHTEMSWLIESQARELAPLAAEFKANGLSAMSLSSSSDDDDLDPANIDSGRTRKVAYDPDPIELASRLRDYEFDQFLQRCSQTRKVYLNVNADGKTVIDTNDKRTTVEELQEALARLRHMYGGALPSAEEIANTRARAEHYKALVWAAMSPAEQLGWLHRDFTVREYLEPGDDNEDRDREPVWALDHERALPAGGGATELGQHDVMDGVVLPEPSEFELWPELV